MKSLKKIICLLTAAVIITCITISPLSATSQIAAKPSAGIQWVGTDAASATLTIVDGLATFTTTVNGKLNVATRIEVNIKLYRNDNGVWRDCGISISDYVSGDLFAKSWTRYVVLEGLYKAEVTVYVDSQYGRDTIVMEPTYYFSRN